MRSGFAVACTIACALCPVALPATALADEAAPVVAVLPPAPPRAPDVTATVSLTAATDYVWRGSSQTNQKPVLFLEVDLAAHGFYLDGRTENVDFSGIKQEYDNRAGYILPIGPVKLDLGFIRYGFVNAPSNIDTLEGGPSLSGDIGKLNLHATMYYTANYFGSHTGAEYYELGATYAIRPNLSASALIAHQQVDQVMHYNTWNLGFDYTPRKGIDLNVVYSDTDTSAFGNLGGARVIASLAFTF